MPRIRGACDPAVVLDSYGNCALRRGRRPHQCCGREPCRRSMRCRRRLRGEDGPGHRDHRGKQRCAHELGDTRQPNHIHKRSRKCTLQHYWRSTTSDKAGQRTMSVHQSATSIAGGDAVFGPSRRSACYREHPCLSNGGGSSGRKRGLPMVQQHLALVRVARITSSGAGLSPDNAMAASSQNDLRRMSKNCVFDLVPVSKWSTRSVNIGQRQA